MKSRRKLKVLIDTNIIINSEDNKHIESNIKRFHNLSKYFDIEVHKSIYDDINRDKNVERKNIILSKIGKYNISDFTKKPDSAYYENISNPLKENDKVDDNLLFTLKSLACDYLITEDIGIHKKAFKLGIKDKVFSVTSFNEYISSLYDSDIKLTQLNNIIHDKLYNVCSEPIDEIFDSLKNDYPGFTDWYTKKVNQDCKGFFILGHNKEINGLCIYDENNDDYNDGIKICTFKTNESLKGTKSGELLLRQIFLYSMEKNKRYLYVEVKKSDDKSYLIDWLLSFGFNIIGNKKTDNLSYVLKKDIFASNINRGIVFNYPYYYFGDNINIFIIPIQSTYSAKLFPNVHSQLSMSIDDVVCGNTIKKSYLSKKNNNQINIGDLIFFYETGTGKGIKEKNKKIISFGIVEEKLYTYDVIESISFIGVRSVYSSSEIAKIVNGGALIINFRYLDELKYPIDYNSLLSNGILKGAPQSITKIDKEKYNFLKNFLGYYYQ